MKVIGPAHLSGAQSREIAAGMQLDIPVSAIYPDAVPYARAGRWLWFREHFTEISPKSGNWVVIRYGFGPLGWVRPEDRARAGRHSMSGGQFVFNTRQRMFKPEHMRRADSRACGQIVAVLPDGAGFRCEVHMEQIDKLKAARGVA